MELYHLHLLGNHDNLYKVNKEFIVNDKVYNNRLYEKVYNTCFIVSRDRYPEIFRIIDNINEQMGFAPLENYASLSDILPLINKYNSVEYKVKALEDSNNMLYLADFAKREKALEDYRKDHEIDKPSRLHSLFACSEEGMNYWINCFQEGDLDVYRIDTFKEPFQSNEQLLPTTLMTYKESYDASKRYFNPRQKDLNGVTDEYLVQGKVKLLEKVYEVRRTK